MTNLATIETWFLLQAALEALLVLLMIFFLLRLRGLKKSTAVVPEEIKAPMERFIKVSERLSAAFTETLRQKKDLSVSLLLKLERKINELNQLLERAEQDLSQARSSPAPTADTEKSNPAAPENRALVIRLADQGLSMEEIARRSRLHRGEVELILDLEKQFNI
ncbi:MAG: hypothetical protein V1742_07390 [Pseudomonadota bacterium]